MQIKQKFGPWAIITGASSGIGKGFCEQLAKQGLNLVLVARNESVLTILAHQIQAQYGVECKVLALDLTQPQAITRIEKSIQGLDVGLLVSNAGAGHMGAFNKVALADLKNTLHLNTTTHLELSHFFVQHLLKQNKKGGILLLSSVACFQGVPLSGNYSAAKAYVLNLGEALNFELKNKGINISVLLPGPTSTPGFHDRSDIDFNNMPMKPMPVAACVDEGLKALMRNKPVQVAGRMNRFMGFMGKYLLSRKMNTRMWGAIMLKMAPPSLQP